MREHGSQPSLSMCLTDVMLKSLAYQAICGAHCVQQQQSCLCCVQCCVIPSKQTASIEYVYILHGLETEVQLRNDLLLAQDKEEKHKATTATNTEAVQSFNVTAEGEAVQLPSGAAKQTSHTPQKVRAPCVQYNSNGIVCSKCSQ